MPLPCQEMSKLLLWHLRATQILAAHAWCGKLMIFKLRPKRHYIWHLAQDLKAGNRLNPRVFACTDEESFLGKLKKVAHLTHGDTMPRRSLQRYILAMAESVRKKS